jgi:enediyne biosynthesis protein E4
MNSVLPPLPTGTRGTGRGALGVDARVFSFPLPPLGRGVRGEGAGPTHERVQAEHDRHQACPATLPPSRFAVLVSAGAIGLLFAGCGHDPDRSAPAKAAPATAPAAPATPASPALQFRAQELPFRYERGETGAAWPVETTGGGVGLLDFDGDGRIDLFFAQGGPLLPGKDTSASVDVLLKNSGGGHFEDVSSRVGLSHKGYGQGVTVADYDGDGDPDVYVTRYGRNTLWRNDRDLGRFTDVTDQAGVGCGSWSLGAAFADYDNDGDLDLFVANYFAFDPARAPFRRDPASGAADYGLPQDFPGLPDVLYRNEGDGKFRDVTATAGVAGLGRGMGVLAADLDGDGRVDWLVANDAQSNALWRNLGDGRFEDVAERIGIAVNSQGLAEANMGIAYGDTDGNGVQDVLITHFFREHLTVWRGFTSPDGGTLYQDQTNEAGVAIDSRPLTGWGTVLADLDLDGHLDLIATNGHIRREPSQLYVYENPPIIWRNQGDGRYLNVTKDAGSYFQKLYTGRGLACGDLDQDGDLDLVIVHHHQPSVVLWNESPRAGSFLIVNLKGQGPNRDAIGARLTASIGNRRLVRTVDGGGSYISASDRRPHLGLGDATKLDRLEVRWPSGKSETRTNVPANTTIDWVEQK